MFNIGDIVYLKVDKEQTPYMIIEIRITPVGVIYIISNGVTGLDCYEIELTAEQNLLHKFN